MARRFKTMACLLIALLLVLVFTFLLIRVPFALRHQPDETDDQAAHRAGALAKRALERYFVEHKEYTADLGALIEIDPTIMESSAVTFHFDQASGSGFRFSTHFSGSPTTFRFASKPIPLFEDFGNMFLPRPSNEGASAAFPEKK